MAVEVEKATSRVLGRHLPWRPRDPGPEIMDLSRRVSARERGAELEKAEAQTRGGA